MSDVIVKPNKDLKAFIYKTLMENNISADVDDIEKKLYQELIDVNKNKKRCMGFEDKTLQNIILQIACGTKKKKQNNSKISIFPTEQAKADKAEREGKDYQIPLL